jgi:hypothetical protein
MSSPARPPAKPPDRRKRRCLDVILKPRRSSSARIVSATINASSCGAPGTKPKPSGEPPPLCTTTPSIPNRAIKSHGVNDAAVSGADPIDTRPGFAALLDRIEGNGVRTVIVEDASRFARELVTQELGILALIKRGVRVLTASGDDLTDSSDPSRKMMRQIAGSFAEYEKARLVASSRPRANASDHHGQVRKRAMPRSIRRW